jgi:hypothetical protein
MRRFYFSWEAKSAPPSTSCSRHSVVVEDGDNLRVLPVVGGSAMQNVKDVPFLRSIDMALTTQETLNYLKALGELGPHLEQQVTYILRRSFRIRCRSWHAPASRFRRQRCAQVP